MYAIIEDGGKQYKVSPGDALLVELRELGSETSLAFDKVLMVGEGETARIGAPYVAGAKVRATLVRELQTPKVVGIKFNRRKGYRKKWGHRQRMLHVRIEAIDA